MSKVLKLNKTDKYYDQWIVDDSYSDINVAKIDRYGDRVDGITRPDQLELQLTSLCSVIFKPNDQELFQISGTTTDEAIANAKRTVDDLITDWESLDETTKEKSNPYMKHLMSMLNCFDSIEYKVV